MSNEEMMQEELQNEYLLEAEIERRQERKEIHWTICDLEAVHDQQTEYSAVGRDGNGVDWIGTAIYIHGQFEEIINIEEA